MSHSSPVVRRLGIPPNPSRNPDVEIRRAYWREVKRTAQERKVAAAQVGSSVCVRRIGFSRCGGVLESVVNRRTGRVSIHCPRCERRAAGLCQTCPRPIVGDVKRGASWCDPCRRRHSRKRHGLRERVRPEVHAARTRRKRLAQRKRMRRDLKSKDRATREAAAAWFDRQLQLGRAAYKRMADRRRAAGMPVSSVAFNREKDRRARVADRARKAA